MTHIEVLGPGCQKCEVLYEHAEQAARELGLEYEIEKVTDIERHHRLRHHVDAGARRGRRGQDHRARAVGRAAQGDAVMSGPFRASSHAALVAIGARRRRRRSSHCAAPARARAGTPDTERAAGADARHAAARSPIAWSPTTSTPPTAASRAGPSRRTRARPSRAAFAEDIEAGRLVWRTVNIEEKGNEHFVKDYQLYTKSLVLVNEVRGKPARVEEPREGLGATCTTRPKFLRYVQDETRAYLARALVTELLARLGSALWLGILTSISPCPLASNIAAISYVGRRVGAAPSRAARGPRLLGGPGAHATCSSACSS